MPTIFSLVVELAEYERAADQVVGNEQLLERALFGPDPVAEALVAELDGEVAGFALFYMTFSTWQCAAGFYDKLGAGAVEDWRLRRLDGDALERAARR